MSVKLKIDPQTLEFALPDELIAQEPPAARDQARLLVYDRHTRDIAHKRFSDLYDFLVPGDVLVLNRARVSPSKFWARKTTGGRVEVIFIKETHEPNVWKALLRPFQKEGVTLHFDETAKATLTGRTEIGENLLACENFSPYELMEKKGVLPLPPYIDREENDPRSKTDAENYQTVFATVPGSIAAPTAGLHFTQELLDRLRVKGVVIKEILLNVGWGTFRPIAGGVDGHTMLEESFDVPPLVYQELQKAKRENRRIIAVGTTVTRTLESLSLKEPGPFYRGNTSLFIKPGFAFKWVSALITNFHVPRSTPVALTAAFVGLDKLEHAYDEAVREKYRFFSYGDAMLIL